MPRVAAVHPVRRVVLRAKSRAHRLSEAWRAHNDARLLTIESVRRRLELFLAAVHGRAIPIEPADSAPESGFFRRHVLRLAEREAPSSAYPATDGKRILLPRALSTDDGAERALARYRLLALLQAARIVRGTVVHHPTAAAPIVRDLYLVREGVLIDAMVGRIRGLEEALATARTEALKDRPGMFYLSRAEREVETLVRRGLAGDVSAFAAMVTDAPLDDASAMSSIVWAEAMAERIGHQRYGWMHAVKHWGTVILDPSLGGAPFVDEYLQQFRMASTRIPGSRSASGSDTGAETRRAVTTGKGTPAEQTIGDPRAPTMWIAAPEGGDAERTGSGGAADREPSTLPPVPPEMVSRADSFAPMDDPASPHEMRSASLLAGGWAQYHEWDHVTRQYRERAVTVHTTDAAHGDPSWSAGVFHEHAVLIRQVRQRFERLQATRVRSGLQLDGDELDIPACVRAEVDRRMGQAPDDRLYMTARTARHPLAIMLLADVSGSTKAIVNEHMRMIDIEKVALLIASEALASMGDRYALTTFAGRGSHGVRVTTVKQFGERAGDIVRQRIAGLEPGGFTRLGAAVRHATALLQAESARHRLLLILSDGRPNDLGEYMADYGVEDTRQAVAEARSRGVYPFCLNVDEEGSEYLARIFGPAGYTSLRRPDQLPMALLHAVRTLIRS